MSTPRPGQGGAWVHLPAPRPRRRHTGIWMPFLVLVLLLGASWYVTRPIGAPPTSGATRYLPSDGDVRIDLRGPDTYLVTESAVLQGTHMVLSGPDFVLLSGEDPSDLVDSYFLRDTETLFDQGEFTTGYAIHKIGADGIRRTLSAGDKGLRKFHPGVLVLPGDVGPGSQWEGSGQMTTFPGENKVDYSFTASASRAPLPQLITTGCLDVEVHITIGGEQETWKRQWCPPGGNKLLPPLEEVGLEDPPSWDASSWQQEELDLESNQPLVWSSLQPSVNTAKTMIFAHRDSHDIIFAADPTNPYAAGRAHPGGRITSLTRFGDVVVATTTRGQVTGYTLPGIRRLELKMPDVVYHPPALLDGKLVAVDAVGNVTAATVKDGEEAWSTSLGDQPSTAPVTCGQHVVFGTVSGEVVALDAQGEDAWEAEPGDRITHMACTPHGLVVLVGGQLLLLDEEGTNTHYTSARESGAMQLLAVGDGVAKLSDLGLTVYDQNLVPRWELPGTFKDLATDGRTLAVLGTDQLVAFDVDGNQLGSWTNLPRLNSEPVLSTTPTGVQVVLQNKVISWES